MNIIILSSKSSGSSALQNYFLLNHQYKAAAYTPHHENETLYWSKVASVLELPQIKMYRSQVPFSKKEALNSLNDFLHSNGLDTCGDPNKDFFFKRYLDLVRNNDFRFIEKSPHHLFNESNLQLIEEFVKEYSDKVEVKIIGLVRHPQAVLYSAWKRWGFIPVEFEREWYTSYHNLLHWQNKLNIEVIKYEDLVQGDVDLEKLLMITTESLCKFNFKGDAVDKWSHDPTYGHRLSDSTINLAKKFGYVTFNPSGNMSYWKLKYKGWTFLRAIKRLVG